MPQNKKLVSRLFNEVLNERKMEIAREINLLGNIK